MLNESYQIVRGLFTPKTVVQHLGKLPPIKTHTIDTFYMNRPLHPFPIIGRDEVNHVIKAIPFIERGGPSIATGGSTGQTDFFEPLPIRPNGQVRANELNNLMQLTGAGRTMWAQNKTDQLRKIVRATHEAVASVAHYTGTLIWAIKNADGTLGTYEIVFGAPVAYVPAKLWTAGDIKIAEIFEQLTEMEEALEENGYGSRVQFEAGKTAFQALMVAVEAFKSTAKMKVEVSDVGISIGGYMITRNAEKYWDPGSKTYKYKVGLLECVGTDLDGGHMSPYCAIDDLDGNNQALPFFIKPVKQDDPSGIKLIAESKPFVSPNMKAIIKATVAA